MGVGYLLYVSKGTLHSHKNLGEGIGRMLVTQTPGGLYERFFDEVGKPAEDEGKSFVLEDQSDMKRIVQIAAEHGIEIPVPTTRCSES